MRTDFHQELDGLGEAVGKLCLSTGDLLEQATTALITVDLAAARAALRRQDDLHRTQADLEESALALLTLPAPPAGDLRRIVAALWIVGELRRMTALAGHIAQAVPRRHPSGVVPVELLAGFARMGEVGCQLAAQAGRALLDRDPDRARALQAIDGEMDRLHRDMFIQCLEPGWRHGAGPAVDTALLSRFYERFADHAVAIGRRLVFQEMGWDPPAHTGTDGFRVAWA